MIVSALAHINAHNQILVGSFGAIQFDLQLAEASRLNVPVELILTADFSIDQVKEVFPFLNIIAETTVSSHEERDLRLLSFAELIYVIWIRKNGRICKILAGIEHQTQIYQFDCSSFRFKSKSLQMTKGIRPVAQFPKEYLWHWTRTRNGVWPQESVETYCRDILDSECYPRSAVQTLKRIVAMNRIIGSSESIGGGEVVVSFTENDPIQMSDHFVWRRGKHRMNFEPYAIGFPKSMMIDRGVVRVRYGETAAWDSMERADRWRSEKEWRVRGDFEFDSIKDLLIVIVRRECEKTLFDGFTVLVFDS